MENMAENTTENKEENNKNGHDTLKKLKNIAKGIGGTMLFATGIATTAINPVLGIAMIIPGAAEIDKRFSKKMQMEGNLFAVGTYREGIPFVGKGIDNFIMMEPRSLKSVIEMICAKIDIKQMVKQSSSKTKLSPTAKKVVAGMTMNYQMLDLLSCLEKCDKNGENINYKTVTHKTVIEALKKMEKLGLVENLTVEPKLNERGKHKGEQKEKSLLIEEILLGNFSCLDNLSVKVLYNREAREKFLDKRLFSNVSFNLTDKALTPDTAKELLSSSMPRRYVAQFLENCNMMENENGSIKSVNWKMELGKRVLRTIKKVPMAIKNLFGKTDRNEEKTTPNLEERSNGLEQVAQVEVDTEKAKEEALRWTLRGHDPNDPNKKMKYEKSRAIAEQAHEENSKSPVVEELKLAREGEAR